MFGQHISHILVYMATAVNVKTVGMSTETMDLAYIAVNHELTSLCWK